MEVTFPRGKLPNHNTEEISIEDLRTFYHCIWHTMDDDGRLRHVDDKELLGIVRIRLRKPGTNLPNAVKKLRDIENAWTKVIAPLVERGAGRQGWISAF